MQIMHAYLITGKTGSERRDKAREILKKNKAGEVIQLQTETSHPISAIREINQRLSLRAPTARGIIIEEAQLLTAEAANSFLKTLEEPPRDTIIILTSPDRELVLETISSRTQHIDLGPGIYKLSETEKEEAQKIFEKLLKAGIGERITFAAVMGKDRKEAIGFVIAQIFAAREFLHQALNGKGQMVNANSLVKFLERLRKTRQDLEANVNVKLSISDLLLRYPHF